MSQKPDIPDDESTPERSSAAASTSREDRDEDVSYVLMVPYPKVIFLYPTFLTTLGCAIVLMIFASGGAEDAQGYRVAASWIFLAVLSVNLIVLTVDFSRVSILVVFFFVSTLILGGVLLAMWKPGLVPTAGDFFKQIRPTADATFFWALTAVFLFILLITKLYVQFNYWEFRRNELLHHHGFLSDLRQYPMTGTQIDKEISDIFEYFLLRSGRLVIRVPGQDRAFVLENVPFVNRKEKLLIELRAAVKVTTYSPRDS